MELTIFIAVLIVLQVVGTSGLIGYSCDNKQIDKVTISLVETKPCIKSKKTAITDLVDIVVSQPIVIENIKILSCLVEIDHLIYRCGKTFETMHHQGFYAEVPTISRSECMAMHKDNLYSKTHVTNVVSEVRIGRNLFTQTTAGSVSEGTCVSHDYGLTLNGIWYDRPVRVSKFSVLVSEITARIDFETARVMFSDGTYCMYKDSSCFTLKYGYSFWDVVTPKCGAEKNYAVVYSGRASRVTETVDSSTVTTYHVSSGTDDFFVSRTPLTLTLCGFKTYHSEHPKMFITEVPSGAQFPIVDKVKKGDLDLVTYINSKLVYVMRHTKAQVDDLYSIMSNERCLTEARVTQNMLTLAILSPTEFAYQYTGQPGHTAVVRGEVAHLFKCHPVSVQLAPPSGKCYNELEVTYNNKTMFMHPRSRILTNIGTNVDCSLEVSTQFVMDGKWIQTTRQGLMESKTPLVIHHEAESFEFKNIRTIGAGGIYSDEMVSQALRIITNPPEQQAMQVNLVRALRNEESLPNGYAVVHGMSAFDYSKLEGKFVSWYSKTYERITAWGSFCSFMLILLMVFKGITTLLNSFINFRVLKNTFGPCLACLCFWWDSMANHMSNGRVQPPARFMPKGPESVSVTIEDIALAPIMTNPYPVLPGQTNAGTCA